MALALAPASLLKCLSAGTENKRGILCGSPRNAWLEKEEANGLERSVVIGDLDERDEENPLTELATLG